MVRIGPQLEPLSGDIRARMPQPTWPSAQLVPPPANASREPFGARTNAAPRTQAQLRLVSSRLPSTNSAVALPSGGCALAPTSIAAWNSIQGSMVLGDVRTLLTGAGAAPRRRRRRRL
jgi:hypothetical protein